MACARDFLMEIEREEETGAVTYEDLSEDLRQRIENARYAPPEIVAQGLTALKSYLGVF